MGVAQEISKRVSFSAISLSKTPKILGKAVDLSMDLPSEDDEPASQPQSQRGKKAHYAKPGANPSSPAQRQTRLERETLLEHANTFRDLENMVIALDAIEAWKSVADKRPQ